MTRWRAAELLPRLMPGLGVLRASGHAGQTISGGGGGDLRLDRAGSHPKSHPRLPYLRCPAFPIRIPVKGARAMTEEEEKRHRRFAEAWWQDEGGLRPASGERAADLGLRPQRFTVGLMFGGSVENGGPGPIPRGGYREVLHKDEPADEPVMIYWLTETQFRRVVFGTDATCTRQAQAGGHDPGADGRVALTTEAVERTPREWVERPIRRYPPLDRVLQGGHFMAEEQPELLAAEIREFFRPLR